MRYRMSRTTSPSLEMVQALLARMLVVGYGWGGLGLRGLRCAPAGSLLSGCSARASLLQSLTLKPAHAYYQLVCLYTTIVMTSVLSTALATALAACADSW
jgi:hypothetical protein